MEPTDPAAELAGQWAAALRAEAAGYAEVALANIAREYPVDVRHLMTGPDDPPRLPREQNPVFFGSFDWHSCVEMHWLLARLLRVAGDVVPAARIRQVLDAQFTDGKLTMEAEFISGSGGSGQRPYGWGWALTLAAELACLDDQDGRRWSAAMTPLAQAVTARLLDWLPKATYPVRHGVHANSAFGLSRALPHATALAAAGDEALAAAITGKALAWFGGDRDYPGHYEPSGQDFLSPALAEAELMSQILPAGEFAAWLGLFLPAIASGGPLALFEPAAVSDASDGQIAHLHGLNASRAWCWRRLAAVLPPADPRVSSAVLAATRHAEAALPHVAGSDYMVEHWLAAYAVLMLS